MNINLNGKVVVITGSSKGIGKSLALMYSSVGAIVIINYLSNKESAEKIAKEVQEANGEVMLIKADVRNRTDVVRMKNSIIVKYGKIDILINNAGTIKDASLLEMTQDMWSDVYNLNFIGTLNCSNVVGNQMKDQGYGKIFNICSIKGMIGSANQVNYSTSKAAVIGFTKSIAIELSKFNILVNAICPGFIVTDMNRNFPSKLEKAQQDSLMEIEDNIKTLANFLIYSSSNYFTNITGQIFCIDSRIS